MEARHLSGDAMALRWDLLESQPPTGERLTVRCAEPGRSAAVLIAVDAARKRYVLVRIPHGEPETLSERTSKGIAVQTVAMKAGGSEEESTFVEIACLEPTGHAALDIVTRELVEALVAGASIGRVRLVQGVLAKWRRFWSGVQQSLLSREELLGLFGELWFLSRWLLPSVGCEKGIAMWRGPSGARNDFEAPGLAIEAKTSSRLDGSHQINGLEQLLEPADGTLLLFSLVLREEASGAESLPGLVAEARAILLHDVAAIDPFESMLLAARYEDAHANEYAKVKLRVRGQALYRVVAGFPRMVPSSLAQGVPAGVSDIGYNLRLDAAKAWLLSDNPSSATKLLAGMAAKASPSTGSSSS